MFKGLALYEANDFLQLLSAGRQQWIRVLESISHRKQSMVGSIAMASGFATYLGVYSYELRQHVLEVTWPNCLQERGIMRDISIADNLTVDITLSMSKIDTQEFVKNLESTESKTAHDSALAEGQELKVNENSSNGDSDSDENRHSNEKIDTEKANTREEEEVMDEDGGKGEDISAPVSAEDTSTKQMKEVESFISDKTSTSLYVFDQYLLAVLKLLIGSRTERNLISVGINYRQLEDAAIFNAAIQTPLLVIDPFNTSMNLLSIIMGPNMSRVDVSNW